MNLTDPSVRAAWAEYEQANERCHRDYLEQRGIFGEAFCFTCQRPVPPSGRNDCSGACRDRRRAHDRARARERRQ